MSILDTQSGQTSFDVRASAAGSMTLPGKGEPGDRCGEWYPKEFCDNCGEPLFGESRCGQRGCPRCWSIWARDRAENITARLNAAREAAETGRQKRAIHAVMSPPDGLTSLRDVYDGFRDAYRLAEEKGIRGGVVIFHGRRVKEKWREAWRLETNAGSDGPNLWQWVREHEKNWRMLVKWSPHYHVLGLAADFQADDPDEQNGWVARRLRSLERFELHNEDSYRDVVGAAMYLLSHASFESQKSKDCVRWFGDLSTASFQPEEELSEGKWRLIQRRAAEAAAAGPPERGDEKSEKEPEEADECPNCESVASSPIWDAPAALASQSWCAEIGSEQRKRLTAAFEWAIGEKGPPPGWESPKSESAAKDAFAAILEERHGSEEDSVQDSFR